MKSSRALQYMCAGAVVLGSILNLPAYAQYQIPGYPENWAAYDPREMAMLPPYCKYTEDIKLKVPAGNPEEAARWRSVMGPTFGAMHHYCWGLMKSNRGLILARTRQARMGWLSLSIPEFDYVIANATPDFKLLPEILTKKGENLIHLEQAGPGIQALTRAIELRPDYWPPYVAMSDYYKRTGDTKTAREVLEKALSFSPNSTTLKTRLAGLETGKDKEKSKAAVKPVQQPTAPE